MVKGDFSSDKIRIKLSDEFKVVSARIILVVSDFVATAKLLFLGSGSEIL